MVQVVRHSLEVQTWPPLQTWLQPPQFAGSRVTSTQAALQLVMHAVPHEPPEQIGRSKVPVEVHAEQLVPQALAKSGGTHSPLQALKPPPHEKPQVVPLQVRVEFAGPLGHAVHRLPQVFTSLFDTQALPQRWKPALQVKLQLPLEQMGVALATGGHETHAAPHWVALESSTQVPPQSW